MSEQPKDLDAAMRAYLDRELVEASLRQVRAAHPGARVQEKRQSPDADVPPQEEPRAEAFPRREAGRHEASSASGPAATPPRFREAIADIASTVLKIPPDRLDVRENMSRYGVDSIVVTEIMKRISDLLDLPIAPTVFFEAKHLEELADILYRRYGKNVAGRFPASEATGAIDAGTPAAARGPREREAAPEKGVAPAREEIEADPDVRRWIAKFRAIASVGSQVRSRETMRARDEPVGGHDIGKGDYEPIAIIAMEGLFPESADLREFEKHLRDGDDCIREVPADRWDWRQVFGDPRQGEFTNVKYGGFAPDIDKFDPLFFGMSPKEAELMDPQHRLFIQCVWKLIESAGYAPKSLSGRKVGIFLGINLQDYAHLVDRSGAMEALHLTSLGHMFCPNRLSFYLDIHGPSQVIDTACSSSLVALHRAVLSIQHEGCELAVAGGANLLISPDMHIMYSKVGMICEDGRCKTFSRHANGYARCDGVGAVLLKPLTRAERDGDTILAVIRGSAENHGGMSTSLTAPNPKAQASLIVEAHRRAGIDPRSVGYIECHGTGTSLGDPIEINGLKRAFEELHRGAGIPMPEMAYCGLGSVKSNIGHAETAAGIAGVIKTILAIRNRRLYPTLHCDDINPMIELERSPFFILQEGMAWQRPIIDGEALPRRAGVSSFGAGGSNAHVVIEEYVGRSLPAVRRPAPSLILLSARSEAQLGDLVESMLRFLNETPDAEAPDIADIAYTLQVGREAMAERLALVVDSSAELRAKLGQIARKSAAPADCYKGNVKRGKGASRTPGESDASPSTVKRCFEEGDARQLADLWTRGVPVDWQALYAETEFLGRSPRRVTLPTYPFAKQRCWLPEGADRRRDRRGEAAAAALHPLVHRNTSDLSEQRFSSMFTGAEFFLADHVVRGERVLPGVAYLEMARAAVEQASPEADGGRVGIRLENVVWARPFAVGGQPASLHIGLFPARNHRIAYRIYSKPEGPEGEPVLHSQGTAVLRDLPSAGTPDRLDLAKLRDAITDGQPQRHCLDARQCYAAFEAMGIAYGPGHQCLEAVYFSAPGKGIATSAGPATAAPEVLAKLTLPASAAREATSFVLHPGLMDSALQACVGLLAGSGHALPTAASADAPGLTASLPFTLEELELMAQPSATMWAWIRYAEGSSPADKLQKLDIDLCDEQGQVCIRLGGFSSRTPEQRQPAQASAALICRPVWVQQSAVSAADGLAWSTHRVVLCDLDGLIPASIEQEIAAKIPGASCFRLHLDGAIQDWYTDATVGVFEAVKEAFVQSGAGRSLIQVAIPGRGSARLLGGLSGLLKTANRESSRVFGQLIELDADGAGSGLVAKLIAESRSSGQDHIRYDGAVRQVLAWQDADRSGQPFGVPWKDNGVYLITGGSGGLGLLFARQIATHARNATVVLCGRSEPGPQKRVQFDQLSSAGLDVRYRQLDVSRREEVDALVAEVMRTSGRIDGVLHCAGLVRDNFIPKKSAQEFREVLAPKVAGTLHLDDATRNIDLDFFALFSSAAGAWGSAGQADYAAANGFMDAFAHHRNAQVRGGQRHGHTVSLDWPLWADGGIRMESAARAMMQQATGLEALPRDAGTRAFDEIVASGASQALVLYGPPVRIRRLLSMPGTVADEAHREGNAGADAADVADTGEWRPRIEQMLLQAVARLMKFELQDLDAHTEWSDYGFDSITLTDFSNRLNQQYRLELTPTIFFEYPTIAALAAWLTTEYGSQLAQALGLGTWSPPKLRVGDDGRADVGARPDDMTDRRMSPASRLARSGDGAGLSEQQGDTDNAVAIIGMSGRFPMAKDLDEFWSNLLAGRDCITEIPADRWDWKALYGDPATEANKTNIKWGGFIDGVGNFDARLFGISSREAELMDPQQRMLMQYAWKAIEDAGYSPSSLSGSNTAIFVGTAPSGYGELVARSGSAIESYSSTGTVGSVGPNRMSYFLNVHGPSEPIETACSSALVAIHRAFVAMANGDCDQAIVGGINLIISPETHISFNKAGMLCPDGRCKSFSKHANGYVRGEGVGMLFLKKLKAAEQAGDHIYGVIRGSAENHGGRGNSLTAPNPKAQAELIRAVYSRSGVDPRTVGYIEAHGTGTELGDPIEINGLKAAFRDLYQAAGASERVDAHCGLGSVKTNIGHLELAAGIAGVIKVLLQLKHKTLVRSLHCDEVNPYIQLEGTPFYLVRENREWRPLRDREGRELPRRAGVSSFGFGGANAHVFIEEYPQDRLHAEAAAGADEPQLPSLVVLSAKSQDRLKAYASELLSFVTAGVPAGVRDAASDANPVLRTLSDRACALVADILQIDPSEIEPAHPLDEYGFEPVHRAMLQGKLQEALGREIEGGVFLRNHSIAAIVAGVLEAHPALRDRLNAEDATSDPAPDPVERESAPRHRFRLADLAYTLQVGREPMDERLAVIARSVPELEHKLRAFIEGRTEAVSDLYVGQIKQNKSLLSAFNGDEELQEALEKWIRRGKFSKLLDLWVKGLNPDWEKLYGESGPYRRKPRRISAPGYPFAEQRHWIEARPPATLSQSPVSVGLHPLVHENVSTLQQAGFRALLTGTEFFLADHRMQGQKVLPGVAYLEMVRAAVSRAAAGSRQPATVFRLQDVIWIRPAIVDQPREIRVDLTPDAYGAVRYEVSSQAAAGGSAELDRQVHSQGIASFKAAADVPRLDPGALLAQAGMKKLDARPCYELFSAAGLDYGPGHRGISELHVGAGQVLARLVLPESVAHTLDQYVLHPSLMDSALQASIGLVLGAEAAAADAQPKLSLPFAVETVDVLGACVGSMWAWVRRRAGAPTSDRVHKLDIDLCDDRGRVCVQIRGFSARLLDVDRAANRSGSTPAPRQRTEQSAPIESPLRAAARATMKSGDEPPAPVDAAELRTRTIGYFKELLSSALKFPVDEIRADEALDSYGIDSMMVMELTRALEKPFGELSKTLFFEYQTLAELVEYFLEAHRQQLLKLFDFDRPVTPSAVGTGADNVVLPPVRAEVTAYPTADALPIAPARPNTGALDIAVIGLSGRYPQSRDIEAFWRNLRDGRDCITEIPEDRWDWHTYYSEDRSQAGRHYCKWGGFIEDADKFDPLFFNVSPSAAEYMDPQERLFLEHAWMAMEDAGYRREDLQKPLRGSLDDADMPAQVGVYAGVMYGEYQLLGLEANRSGKSLALGNFYASIANRVSYVLNLHGPSMAIDTMCSSSLTAIHLACQDLKLGRTDLALAGGVNLNVHPNKYGLLSAGQFISSSGKCESFGSGGDGYVPSEGVGVVLLKRLADAERDGDHIYGVIKSSALNHGGKTNGYSVPNPKAQQMVITRALRDAHVDPRAIGYIEAHGTGTKLGDPIEIAGLTKAFGQHMTADQSCWIGSSKSNIGHSEAAAGIAGLTKVLLQMREGQIAPSLHSQTLNPNIDFSTTPFRVNQQLREWPRPVIDGRPHRRVAGVSSFGAGGANAHLVVEEHIGPEASATVQRPAAVDLPCVVVLSAKTEQQLGQYAESLLEFVRHRQLDARGGPSLRDMAYTLQVGREGMQQRLGFLASSVQEMTEKLGRFLNGRRDALHVGRAKPGAEAQSSTVADHETAADLIVQRRYDDLLAVWVKGVGVDWHSLYAGDDGPPSRVSLPTYPFARERYWIALPEQPRRTDSDHRPTTVETTGAPFPVEDRKPDFVTIQPVWKERAIRPRSARTEYAEHRVLSLGRPLEVPGAISVPLQSAGQTIDRCFGDHATQLFEQIKDIFRRKPGGSLLLQIVIGAGERPSGCPDHLSGALAAMLKAARMENPRFVGQLIELDAAGDRLNAAELAVLLRDNGQVPAEQHVRYRQGKREVLTWTELDGIPQTVRTVWRQGGTYLITGGAGGLGLIFAREIVRQVDDVSLILTGRSPLDDARRADIEALRAQGARVEYRPVDVGDRAAVADLIESIERDGRNSRRGSLNGIIHSAGIIRDNFVIKKTAAELQAVLAAKVSGVVNLDLASRPVDLDFFVLFSSLAGAVGNPGQSDYATANAFLDAYAAYRNGLAAGTVTEHATMPRPKGHTLSINWPLWQQGGMDVDAQSKEMMWRTAGLRPLQIDAGIEAFYQGLGSGRDQVMVLQGDVPRLRQLFLAQQPEPPNAGASFRESVNDRAPESSPGRREDKKQLVGRVAGLISKLLAEMLKLPVYRIDVDVPLEQYGIDSVAMMKLINDLEKILGPLPKTLLFEYPTIEAVSAYLAGSFAPQLATLFELAPAAARSEGVADAVARSSNPVVEMFDSDAGRAAVVETAVSTDIHDIAVIGMSGRFPQAKDLAEFWQNLAQGRDCITEVPTERWDHRPYFDPDRSKAGKTYCKWGGFLDDVGGFDASFFKISPNEAELLDPQERLFLETVWNLLESSGYLGETLQRLCQSRVGVFVGSMSQQYHAFDSDPLRESLVVMSSPSSIANRVSYFFNFQGPSIAIDTMCSSALIAVHMACESLLRGDCRIAVAGGVNVTIHPKKYVGLSAGQMIGSHPDSTSFGDGDGYLPAEGVGAVLLKPLRDAIADSDDILAVVKSTAMNHSGQSNGYRVPSASAQADLIAENFARAGIDPRTVTYVESAANGSLLGDAIELGALTSGFRKYTADRQFCAIGSVKSNIGHAEAASGMSQLIKVILQLRHRQLAPTIKAQPLNPNISFEQTPFYLQRRLEEWRRPVVALHGGEPREYPRRATVSSFGAGGSNAHLIVEEYESAGFPAPVGRSEDSPQLILLSARTAPQLDALAQRMLAFIEQRPDLSIADLAYTLQTARETMSHRLALAVEGRDQLIRGLRAHLQHAAGSAVAARVFTGNNEQDNSDIKQLLSGRTGQSMLEMLLAEKDLDKLALYWVKGARIAWQPMHGGRSANRIALPTYPFDRRRHWLPHKPVSGEVPDANADRAEAFVIDAQQSVRDNIERYLAYGLTQLLGITADKVDTAGSFQDHGLDSVGMIRLRQGLEQVFHVKISARDSLAHPTPAALADFAATRHAASQRAEENPDAAAATESASETASTPATPGDVTAPLSEGQKGLWLLHQLAPQMSAYNVPVALRFGGGLDIGLFRQACEHMLRRFPVLGSVLGQHNGELYQRVPGDAQLHFEHERTDGVLEADIVDLLRAKSKQPFDLERGPLFRVHVLSPTSGKDSYVLITVHHVVFDGGSAVLLMKALLEAYRALLAGCRPELPPGRAGYGDFVDWQRQFMASERAQEQLNYWREQLGGDLPTLSLPCDYPRPARQSFIGASHEADLEADLARRIRGLARSLQVNPSVVFLGALNLVLHRSSGDDDILVGMPTSGRPEGRFDDVVGYFVNMIVVRSRISGQQAVADFLKGLQLTIADVMDHADYPFPALLQALRIDRDPARSPLFQVMFAYQNFVQQSDVNDLRYTARATPPMEILSGINQEGSHDLALEVYQGASGFRLRIDYNTELFAPDTIRRVMRHYTHLLESIASLPNAAIADHALLSPEEKRQIVAHGSAGDVECDTECSIVELFQRQAGLTPDKTALLFEHQSLSYRELDRRSSQLANSLLDRGLADADPVGVCMERGPQMIVAMLAIWKAGAVYVPVAPDCPRERICHLIHDSGMKLVITDARVRDAIAASGSASPSFCLAVDELRQEISDPHDQPTSRLRPEHAAYVIYTSGSTGQPKGVVIPHRAIAHHCQVMRDYYRLTPHDKILLFASMNVDASLEQALPGLLCGASVIVRPDILWSAQAFRAKVAELGITVIDVPPSYLHELLLDTRQASDWAALSSLRLAITGGEALMPETLDLWRGGPLRACRLVNAYGPTETTITSTVFEIGMESSEAGKAGGVPIGRPLPGESVYILDAYGQPVPVGIPGELHIGGVGLAIGYLNQPELTRQKFIDNPVDPGSRIYRTGDRARWLDDGTIAFLGRLDHQVKVRGFRVECGEVEAALQSLDAIKQAVVLSRSMNGGEQLVAFVVLAADKHPDVNGDLKQALARTLPDYMIPAVFVPLAQIPLTPGGKVDRAALMRLDLAASQARSHVEPRSQIEARLAGIWRQVLNVERVGVYDNFFDRGGHSLLAVRLMALVHREFGREVPISSLFEAPDIAGQAQILQRSEPSWSPLVCLQPDGELTPWFCVHAVSGNVLCYRELSRHMGRQRPFYVLQAPDAAGGAHAGTIEGLAALYIGAIRNVQPRGPYHLGGWSMGGTIAYEMARQLQQAGEQVATLALIDSYPPDVVKAFEQDRLQQSELPGDGDETSLLMAFAREIGIEESAAMQIRSATATDLTERLDHMLDRARQASLLSGDIDSAQLHRMFAVFRANARAMTRYAAGRYRGNMALFAAGGTNGIPGDGKHGGWSKVMSGDLTTVAVPGDHYSILQKPNVRHLSSELIRYLNENMD
jgi:polyketide synthase PksN